MASKKKTSRVTKTRFLNQFVEIPRTFFGEKWAKDTYGPDYQGTYAVAELHTFKKGDRGHEDCYLFDLEDSDQYHLPLDELIALDEKGLVHGNNFHFVYLELMLVEYCLCVCSYQSGRRRRRR